MGTSHSTSLVKICDFEHKCEIVFSELHEAVKLIANADIQRGDACYRGGGGIEDGCMDILIESIISVTKLVEIYDMEAVASACPAFYTVNLYRVICVDVEVELADEPVGVHAIGRGQGPSR